MLPDHLWEDRESIIGLASLCTAEEAIEALHHFCTAEEACEIAATWQRHLRGRNQPAATYWATHQADCHALACYHLKTLAGIIGWTTETNTKPTTES